jgi:hypothetical protein
MVGGGLIVVGVRWDAPLAIGHPSPIGRSWTDQTHQQAGRGRFPVSVWVNFYSNATGLPVLVQQAGFWPQPPGPGDRLFVPTLEHPGSDELWEVNQRTWFTPTTLQVFVSRYWSEDRL